MTIHRLCVPKTVYALLVIHTSLQAAEIQVRVGPNIRVGEGKTRQAEPYIAAHPEDARSLIISASEVVDGLEGKGLIAKSYFSNDGGQTWSASELPGLREQLVRGNLETVLDNWITFGPNGEAYYTALALPRGKGAPIYVFRSPDKGHTWYGPNEIASSSFDQPRTTASLRDGKVRIYIAATSGDVVLLGSDDDGRSFNTLSRIKPDNLPHQAMNPLVLADGSLLLPYVDFGSREKLRLNSCRIYVARSEDGGNTFGLPRFVADMARPYPGTAHISADLSGGKFRGRVYATWEDGDFGPRWVRQGDRFVREESGSRREVGLAHSTDNGETWSAPKILRAEGRGAVDFATLAVSSDGVLGVLWVQDERYEIDPHSYSVWFAASVDGGDTFSPPVSISSEPSRPGPRLNPEPYFTYRPRGGDYIGLAAATNGSFHAVWIDARDGAFRLYTTRIEVRR